MTKKRVSFLVHGKVQGVFFRDFTVLRAKEHGLTGWVRNTNDAKVQGEAQGEEASLEKLKTDLNEGPRLAHVVKLEFNEIPVAEDEGRILVPPLDYKTTFVRTR